MQRQTDSDKEEMDIFRRVDHDDSPSLLIWLDADGVPRSLNRAAFQFAATKTLDFDVLFAEADGRSWKEQIAASKREQKPVSGCFRVRRFDNALRDFVLRAEPRFDHDGHFIGHLVSGLDVTEVISETRQVSEVPRATTPELSDATKLRRIAQQWHDELVSAVTVIAISSDLLPDLLSSGDSHRLAELLNRVSTASDIMRAKLESLNSIARNV